MEEQEKPIDCVIYTRVSTPGQEETGLSSQIESLRQWAVSNNHNIIREFSDVMSGVKEREDFEKMKDYVLKKKIKKIVCWEISRFGRSAFRSKERIIEFQEAGVDVFFKEEGVNTLNQNSSSKLQLDILFALAEFERDMITARFARGRETSLVQRKRIGMPKVPYGISFDGEGQIIPHPEESKIVADIFEYFLEGNSYGKIADLLSHREDAITRNGNNDWSPSTVRHILKHKIHTGYREYKGRLIDLKWKKPTITETTWEKAREVREKKINYYNSTHDPARSSTETHKFKGKIQCGHCKRQYGTVSEKFQTKTEEKILYSYRCSGISKKGCKESSQFNTYIMDNTGMVMMLGSENYIRYLYDEDKQKKHFEEIKIKKKAVQAKLDKIEERKTAAKDIYASDADRVGYNRRMLLIAKDEKKLKEEWNKLEDARQNFYKLRDKFKLMWNNQGINRTKIEKLVEKVVVHTVENWNFDWNQLPKKFNWVGYNKDTNTLESQELDRGMNQTPQGSKDKVVYIELYFFHYDTPEKAVFTTATKNIYVGQDLVYKPKSKTLILKSTQTA